MFMFKTFKYRLYPNREQEKDARHLLSVLERAVGLEEQRKVETLLLARIQPIYRRRAKADRLSGDLH